MTSGGYFEGSGGAAAAPADAEAKAGLKELKNKERVKAAEKLAPEGMRPGPLEWQQAYG